MPKAKRAHARTREERLRLFDRHINDLIDEPGSHATWSVKWKPEGVSTEEPGRQSFRSWLISVRLLDDPKADVNLPKIMDDIEALAGAEVTHQRVAVLRQRRARANTSPIGIVIGPDGPMTARDCFEDLAYTEHFHYDAEREARRMAMPPFIWEMVRLNGWDYASELADIATWVQAAGREDPATAYLFAPLPGDTGLNDTSGDSA